MPVWGSFEFWLVSLHVNIAASLSIPHHFEFWDRAKKMVLRDESLPKFFEAYLELYDFVGEKSAEALIFKWRPLGNESFIKIQ